MDREEASDEVSYEVIVWEDGEGVVDEEVFVLGSGGSKECDNGTIGHSEVLEDSFVNNFWEEAGEGEVVDWSMLIKGDVIRGGRD